MSLLRGQAANIPLLIAPMGASAVLLFAVPASPLAQPWSIMGGNLVSATLGVTCAYAVADPVLACALAVALSIGGMFALRCVHPPSGAVALTAVLGGPAVHMLGYRFVFEPVAVQSGALLLAAIAYHAATGHRYPHAGSQNGSRTHASDQPARHGFTRADLEAVLRRRSEMLDIDPDDIESLLRETQLQAYSRSFDQLSCADIMSSHVVSLSADSRAATAWEFLQHNKVKALPVVDADRRVLGIVTRADLIDKRTFGRFGFRTVGALMSTDVRTVDAAQPIAELVPIFANHGHHHIPVLDPNGRLAGMITQVDLISGLHRQTLVDGKQAA